MNDLFGAINKYFPNSNNYTITKNAIIFTNKNKKYVVKRNKNNIIEKYNYLKSRGFNNIPEIILNNNDIYVYNYERNIEEPNEYRVSDLFELMILLHNKTVYYKELSTDEIKEIYEDLNNRILNTYTYYDNICNKVEQEEYYSPSHYLLIRNISVIFNILDFSKDLLNNWYQNTLNNKKTRFVLLHNNLSLNHEISNGNKKYLISFDNSKDGMCIQDFIKFYKKYYNNYDFISLFDEYNKKVKLTENEISLLFTQLFIPDMVLFNKDEILNAKELSNLYNYIYTTNELFMKNQTKNTKEENNKVNE